jgi:hypothetical protein
MPDSFQRFAGYDSVDLITKIAALQLAPENVSRLQRLYAVAGIAATTPPDDEPRPQMSSGRLRVALNQPPLSESHFAHAEDPFNNTLTDTIAFYGGSYTVLSDYDGDAAYVFRRLAEAIFLSEKPLSRSSFAEEARDLCLATLALNDAVTKRAGFGRIESYTEEPFAPFYLAASPGGTGALRQGLTSLSEGYKHPVVDEWRARAATPGDISLPPSEGFANLQRAVSFTQGELAALLGRVGVSANALDSVTIEQGEQSFPSRDIDSNPLKTRPLLRTEDGLVVALPRVLLSAACNALIRKALAHEVGEELTERFRGTVAYNVQSSLETLGCIPLQPLDPGTDESSFSLPLFSLDSDKVIHVLLLTEDTERYEPDTRRSQDWQGGKVTGRIKKFLVRAEEAISSLPEGPNDVLHLVVLQSLEPITTLVGLRQPKTKNGRHLLLDASDLETISTLEAGDQLALWKYAGEQLRFRQDVKVHRVSSQLDEFHAYRRYGYGYDFFQTGIPRNSERVFVTVPMGGAGALRREAQRKRDFHGAHTPGDVSTIEVASFYEDYSIPIYAPWHVTPQEALRLLIEVLPLNLWVTAPNGIATARLRGLYLQFAEAVAYWVWQLGPSLGPYLREVASRRRQIVIHLELDSEEGWFEETPDSDPSHDEMVRCAPTEVGDLMVRLHPSAKHLFGGADNAGEREFLRTLLRGFSECLEVIVDEQGGLTEAGIEEILGRHAPLGRKKKLLFMGGEQNMLLVDEDLPAYRKVQGADLNQLRDELGVYLSSEVGMPRGPVPEGKRTDIVGSAVDFFYGELERMVAGLSPEGLLETLTAYNERLLNEYAQQALRMPTWVECFGTESEMIGRLRREVPELSDASLATRFIIEYVVARQPQGEKLLSLATYDRLVALASRIINWGFTSDAIHYRIGDHELEVSGSGRLVVRDVNTQTGHERFMDLHLSSELYRTKEGFELHWERPAAQPRGQPEKMNRASTAEFGLSLDALTDFLLEASRLGTGDVGEPRVLAVEDFIVKIRGRLGWHRRHVEQAYELFSLRPRSSFLKPPEPFESTDVYPWRFNRRLSHLRRPLLVRVSEQTEEIVWGPKACFRAALYLSELCFEGRLKAKSKAMQSVISDLNHQRSESFNDAIAEYLADKTSLPVERRVKKIAGRRLQRQPGQELGDIDVLIVDSKRRLLLAIETKDLAFARTPAELTNELRTTFATGNSKPSAADRHLERAAWLRENLLLTLGWLGITGALAKKRWRVEPLMVVDHELRSPYIADCPLPVFSFLELQASYENLLKRLDKSKS